MLVAGGTGVESPRKPIRLSSPTTRTTSSKTSSKSSNTRTEKAKEVVKKAIKNGKLPELLWGRDNLLPRKLKKIRQSNYINHVFLEELKQTLQDAMDMDDITIWNNVLMQRAVHGKNIFPERPSTTELEEAYGMPEEDDDYDEDEEEEEGNSEEDNADEENGEDEDDAEKEDKLGELPALHPQQDQEGAEGKSPKKLKKKKKIKKATIAIPKAKTKSKSKEDKKKRKASVSQSKEVPEVESLASKLKNFDTLPILDGKEKYYIGNIQKPKRVSQIIKDLKSAQQKGGNHGSPSSPIHEHESSNNGSESDTESQSTEDDTFSDTEEVSRI